MKVAFIDNFDSFTFNLVHYLKCADAEVVIFHNTELIENLDNISSCDAILIGPGPNTPHESGDLMIALPRFLDLNIPILGVCLGLQALGEFFGMKLKHAKTPIHGKPFAVNHCQTKLFKGIENPMIVGRYHSLILEETESSKNQIIVTAKTSDEEIMAIQHRVLPIEAVQFHPESVLTPEGQILISNWISKSCQ